MPARTWMMAMIRGEKGVSESSSDEAAEGRSSSRTEGSKYCKSLANNLCNYRMAPMDPDPLQSPLQKSAHSICLDLKQCCIVLERRF